MSALRIVHLRRTIEDRDALIAIFLPICYKVANSWGTDTETREEAFAECSLKMVELVSTTEGDLAEGYVATSLWNHMNDIHARTTAGTRIPAGKLVYIDAPVCGSDGSEG